MQKRHNGDVVYYLCIAILITFIGCSIEQKHKTLTFFFDGVDNGVFVNKYLSTDSLSKESAAKRELVLQKNRPDLIVHKPFKERKCEECHTPDKHLRMPLPALCFKCHGNFVEKDAYVHGPVASGNCLKCHNQHSSKYAKLLIRPGQQLCLFCHNSTLVYKSRFHRDIEDAECTMCHNPHSGNRRYMIRDAVASNISGLIMKTIDDRRLYAQLFSYTPGDFTAKTEIKVVNDEGEIVSTAFSDATGKFPLINFHPDINYTFRFAEKSPDMKINVTDHDGNVLYVVEKNRKGKYVFDKASYESTHEKLGTAPAAPAMKAVLAVVTAPAENKPVEQAVPEKPVAEAAAAKNAAPEAATEFPADKKADEVIPAQAPGQAAPANQPGKIVVETLPESVTTSEYLAKNRGTDTAAKAVENTEPSAAGLPANRSRIVVKELPGQAMPGEGVARVPRDNAGEKPVETKTDFVSKNGTIQAKQLPDEDAAASGVQEVHGLPSDFDRQGGDRLSIEKLAKQITHYYGGNAVAVINESGELLGIGRINDKGNFLVNGYLPTYHINMPGKSKAVLSQVFFLSKNMDVIRVVNKVNRDNVVIYETDTAAKVEKPTEIQAADEERPFSDIIFAKGSSQPDAAAQTELDRIAEYMIRNTKCKVQMVGYSGSEAGETVALAQARVKAAMQYLVSHGVQNTRISAKGYSIGKLKAGRDERERKVDIYIKN